ncbi:hypothetical protein TW80_16460 [Loktanella sp. S4079]|nr:hypothetical protein TW80_16460 [Loktanella sp. S4079]
MQLWECTDIFINSSTPYKAAVDLFAALGGLVSALHLSGLIFSNKDSISSMIECYDLVDVNVTSFNSDNVNSGRVLWARDPRAHQKLLEKSQIDPLEPILALENCDLTGINLHSYH